MTYQEKIADLLLSVLEAEPFALSKKPEEITKVLEVPKDTTMGDWAFPCFILAKELKKAPPQIAKEIHDKLSESLNEQSTITEVNAVGPYLNFFLSKTEMAESLIPAILEGSYLKTRPALSDKVMVEYSQPNTHKAFHVGHIRCAALGDSIIRLLEWIGHEVVAANYLGDEGTHVAKCLWYYKNYFKGDVPTQNRGEFLGDLYTKATLLLDLSLLSDVPYPGLSAAKVLSIDEHPQEKKWKVVKLQCLEGERTVICGGKDYQIGDLVAYAKPETKVRDKAAKRIEKKGVLSEGMLCSEAELGLSQDKDKIVVLPKDTEIGQDLVELYRRPDAQIPKETSVLEEYNKRHNEVGKVLQDLEKGDAETVALWQETKQWSMDEYYKIYSWLNCRFDHYFFESEFGESGKALVKEFHKKGIFVESDGAIGADLNKHKLGFCLLIKQNGTALYATRDLTLAKRKFEEFGIDRSLYVVDVRQSLHFEQVFKCLELMGYKQAAKCKHLPYGYVGLPDGTMSSRKGNVILFSELQERLIDKINSEFLDKYKRDWDAKEIAEAGHRIALATMRYGMLKHDNASQIIFDLNEWTERTGNTGPYLMYAYARTRSILREAGTLDFEKTDWSLLTHKTEEELILHLNDYHNSIQRAAKSHSPILICNYVYELSKKFSRMYRECSVINADSEELKVTRARLVEAVGLVIQHGLALLGIHSLERM